jgi:hypothetical protein
MSTNRRTLLIILMCVTLFLALIEAKPKLLSSETISVMSKHLESSPPQVKAVGSDIISQLFNDFANYIKEPSSGRFLTLVGDLSMFYLIPFMSGFLRTEARRQYTKDRATYVNAEISELDIYKESIGMFKDKFWQVFGKLPRDTNPDV